MDACCLGFCVKNDRHLLFNTIMERKPKEFRTTFSTTQTFYLTLSSLPVMTSYFVKKRSFRSSLSSPCRCLSVAAAFTSCIVSQRSETSKTDSRCGILCQNEELQCFWCYRCCSSSNLWTLRKGAVSSLSWLLHVVHAVNQNLWSFKTSIVL